MKGTIFIENMRLHAYHGVMEQERIVGNDYSITLRVDYPIERATATDDVNDTINYATLAEIIRQEMSVPSSLVEHVAGRILHHIEESFPDAGTKYIRIIKIAPPMSVDCDGAGVEFEL